MTTSVRFHFRPSTKAGHSEGKLFIRLIHKRRVKNLPRHYSVFPSEWNRTENKILISGDNLPRSAYLRSVSESMKDDLAKLRTVIALFGERGEYTVEDVARDFFSAESQDDDLLAYSERLGKRLKDAGRERTARAYRSAAKSLILFNRGYSLKLTDIDPAIINAYEKYLKGRGLALNSISFYMRNLRVIYNRAVREKILPPQGENPFADVYTGIAQTEKRALDKKEINALAGLDRALGEKIADCRRRFKSSAARGAEQSAHTGEIGKTQALRDSLMYFMFCFHARGMSYVDMAYLKKSEVRHGYVVYQRKKTGQRLNVKITAPMRRIINSFADRVPDSSPYLFPVIDPARGNERRQYESGLRIQNKRLDVLGEMAGLVKKIATHVSRHSWATIAKNEMVNISLISEALGHKDIKTTIIYLASFETSKMDRLSDRMSGVVKKIA